MVTQAQCSLPGLTPTTAEITILPSTPGLCRQNVLVPGLYRGDFVGYKIASSAEFDTALRQAVVAVDANVLLPPPTSRDLIETLRSSGNRPCRVAPGAPRVLAETAARARRPTKCDADGWRSVWWLCHEPSTSQDGRGGRPSLSTSSASMSCRSDPDRKPSRIPLSIATLRGNIQPGP